MPWYYFYRASDGFLVTEDDRAPTPDLLALYSVVERPVRVDLSTAMWDPVARAFVARPRKVMVDRLQDLADDPALAAVWTRLTPGQRTTLRDRLILLLGHERFRAENDPVDLGG